MQEDQALYSAHTPADPRDVLIEQAYLWTLAWCPRGADGTTITSPACSPSSLPKLAVAEFRRRAVRYTAGKQVGCDFWLMLDVAKFPDGTLLILSAFFSACEASRT